MKALRHRCAFATLLAAALPVTARAAGSALWRSEAELIADYGEPVEIRRNFDGQRTFTWESGDLVLRVERGCSPVAGQFCRKRVASGRAGKMGAWRSGDRRGIRLSPRRHALLAGWNAISDEHSLIAADKQRTGAGS